MITILFGIGQSTYLNFGIPFFQGFVLVALSLSILSYWILYLIDRKLHTLFLVFVLMGVPILFMSRGLFIILFLQLLCLYILLGQFSLKKVGYVFVSLLFIVFLFGFLGDLRVGNSGHIYRNIKEGYSASLKLLPSGFVWGYNYLTASLHNLNYNLPVLEPIYRPYYSVEPLIPSPLRNFFLGDRSYEEKYVFLMENLSNNVFSYFATYLKDFGMFGTQMVLFFIFSITNLVYDKLKRGEIWALFVYPTIFMAIVMSVFYNYFTTLVIILQCITAFISYRGYILPHYKGNVSKLG